MRRDEIERTLEAMGQRPAERMDDAAVARLAERWRAAAGGGATGGTVVDFRPHRRRPLVIATAGLAACAAAATVGLVLSRESPSRVVVADAEDIVIVLPDGQFVDPEPGETLPEGAFVQAGPYAQGRIGDNEVKPDDLFVVRHGHLKQAEVEELAAATPESSAVVTTQPAGQSSLPHRAAVATTAQPAATAGERTTSTATTTSTSTTTTVATTVPATTLAEAPESSTVERKALRVTATRDGDAVRLDWKDFTGGDFERYAVFRVKKWNGKAEPKGGKIATITDRSASSYVDSQPEPGTVYVVVVLGKGKQVLAIGGAASPLSADATQASVPDDPGPGVDPSIPDPPTN